MLNIKVFMFDNLLMNIYQNQIIYFYYWWSMAVEHISIQYQGNTCMPTEVLHKCTFSRFG